VKDANGNTIGYDYDLNNKLLRKTYPDGDNVSYVYDANGNRISMTDSLGTSRYSYDILNRLTAVDGPDVDDMISYSYDAVGNRVSMTDQDGNVTSYKYDGLNRLADITDLYGRTSFYGYDTLGNIISKSYPNGIVSEYTYDGMNNLTRLGTFKEFMLPHYFFHRGSRTFRIPVESYAYNYDPAGIKIMQFDDSMPPVRYAYDTNNQLVEIISRGCSQKYSYDLLGNMVSSSGISHLHGYQGYNQRGHRDTENLVFNADNSLLNVSYGRNAVTNFDYDANGNMISKTEDYSHGHHGRGGDNTVKYSYDYENRMIRIAYQNGRITEYVYDGDGKRVRKIENGKVTKYLYDGMNVIIERDSKDKTLVSYIRGLSYGGGIGGIISKNKYSGKIHGQDARATVSWASRPWNLKLISTWYYHYDGNGNVTLLTDSSGIPAQKYSYDSWGNLTSESGYVENHYRFQTKEYDERSGLYYFGARYYNPEFRRWTQKDPLGMIDGLNMYLYCQNNPMNLIDPYGLCKKNIPGYGSLPKDMKTVNGMIL